MATMNKTGGYLSATAKALFLLLIASMYFVPLIAATIFGFTEADKGFSLDPLLGPLQGTTFTSQLGNSLFLMVATALFSLLLFLPTLIWLHLSAPKLLVVAEVLSILPFVVPAIALVSGATFLFRPIVPGFMASIWSLVPFYVVLSMPLVYRALDAGIRSLDLRTLFDAATSLGAKKWRVIVDVIVPNMSSAIIIAVLLTFIMALGEYVLAGLLLHRTFPTFLIEVSGTYPKTVAALSTIVILGTWGIMVLSARILSYFTGKPTKF